MESPRSSDPVAYPGKGSPFRDLLAFHIGWGTRPRCSLTARGVRWKRLDLAREMGAQTAEQSTLIARKIGQWLQGTLPVSCDRLLDAFFGADENLADWRGHLSDAYEVEKSRRPIGAVRTTVRPAPNLAFVGRKYELQRINELLASSDNKNSKIALTGLPGVGKTQLAAEFVNQYGHNYGGTWWCRTESAAELLLSFESLANKHGIPLRPKSDLPELAGQIWDWLGRQPGRWLLVCDNVIGPKDVDWLHPPANVRLIITSRHQNWATRCRTIRVGVLSSSDAVKLLRNLTDRGDDGGASRLCAVLGHLPLALDHAGATCATTRMTFDEYASSIKRLIDRLPDDSRYPRSVRATFTFAINDAASRHPSARTLMLYLAFCASDRIPIDVLAGALPNADMQAVALKALDDVSLIRDDPISERIPAVSVHRLIQLVAREQATREGTYVAIATQLALRLDILFPKDATNTNVWSLCNLLIPHVISIWKATSSNPARELQLAEYANLINRAGNYLISRRLLEHGIPMLRSLVALMRSMPNGDVATAVCCLGNALIEQGDYTSAKRALEEALDLAERHRDRPHHSISSILNNLGAVLTLQQDLNGATAMLERALTLDEHLHTHRVQNSHILNNLAALQAQRGDLDKARDLYVKLLPLRESQLGPAHPLVANSLMNRALLYEAEGNFDAARNDLLRTKDIFQSSYGGKHSDFGFTLVQLGSVTRKSGNPLESRSLLETALNILREADGDKHPRVGDALDELHATYTELGDHVAAREAIELAIGISSSTYGPEHIRTITQNLARIAHP